MPLYTSRNALITFSAPGVTLDNKSWDVFQGGGHQSDTQNYPPGGMGSSVAVGGVSRRAPITIERAWDDTMIGALIGLDRAVNGPCSVGVTPLRNATTPAGSRRTYTGIVKEVNPPENDSTSSTVSKLTVVIEPDEQITD